MGTDNTSDSIKNTDTQPTGLTRDEKGRITGGTPPAGFNVHPENQSPGGWRKENTISYQYNRFMNMTPDELIEWSKTPNNERTVAMDLAYNRVLSARKSLPDIKEITDRTEGKAPQSIDVTSDGEKINNGVTDPELAKEFASYLKQKQD